MCYYHFIFIGSDSFHIYIDFEGHLDDGRTSKALHDLRQKQLCKSVLVLAEKEVAWFPRHISDLDFIANRTLDAGDELEADHPGFLDPGKFESHIYPQVIIIKTFIVYRARRTELAQVAKSYRQGENIPVINYSKSEIETWGVVYQRLKQSQANYACHEYLKILPLMEQYCGYSTDNIPQAQDISNFLKRRTGFQLRPVAGLLSSRDFLNALAFRVFFSTQYIR